MSRLTLLAVGLALSMAFAADAVELDLGGKWWVDKPLVLETPEGGGLRLFLPRTEEKTALVSITNHRWKETVDMTGFKTVSVTFTTSERIKLRPGFSSAPKTRASAGANAWKRNFPPGRHTAVYSAEDFDMVKGEIDWSKITNVYLGFGLRGYDTTEKELHLTVESIAFSTDPAPAAAAPQKDGPAE